MLQVCEVWRDRGVFVCTKAFFALEPFGGAFRAGAVPLGIFEKVALFF
jgi:hypothetical protein